jgi:putative membrane protein
MTLPMFARTAVAAFALAATASFAQTAAPEYVMKSGAGDLYEINSSQIVLQTTQDPKIKSFANMMIKHHMKTTATVTAAAKKAGMNPPPPALDAPKADMINQLYMASGTDRDKLYLQQQKMSHDEALALQQTYAKDGDTPQLRRAAAKAVPIVKSHIAMLDKMGTM